MIFDVTLVTVLVFFRNEVFLIKVVHCFFRHNATGNRLQDGVNIAFMCRETKNSVTPLVVVLVGDGGGDQNNPDALTSDQVLPASSVTHSLP